MPAFKFIGDPRCGGHGPETVELFGFVFGREDWTEVDDATAERAERHSHLEKRAERAKPAAPTEPNDKLAEVRARGAKAKAEGKNRKVPPAYSGKPEGDAWIAGYDETDA